MEMEKDIGVSKQEDELIEGEPEEAAVEEIPDDANPQADDLQLKLKELTNENQQLRDRMLRIQAEFENYKRRTEKEKIAERKYKVQDLAIELLPVMDNFERALQTEVSIEDKGFFEGIQMVYNQLGAALSSQEINVIDAIDKEFDPNLHHAVMQVENEALASNIVVEELQKGYTLKDKVIRPSMVKVNK